MYMKKKWTNAEKEQILKEAQEKGVQETLNKHGLYPATYYYWKRKYEELGKQDLEHGNTKEKLKRIRELEDENIFLKKIIAEKEIEGRLKDELIKKKYPWANKKK